jgi:hypothetical protein
MGCLGPRAVVWLLALVLPFQVLTAVYLDVIGPLHFHVEIDDHIHEPERAHSHLHSLGEGHAERHHHPPDQPGVVTVHSDGVLDPLAVEGEIKSGWSAKMLVALLAGSACFVLLTAATCLVPGREHSLKSRFPGRLERPPRIDPV